MMNLNAAKIAVGKLLTETGVTAVYYVDDKFQEDVLIDEQFEKFQLAINRRFAEGQIDDLPAQAMFPQLAGSKRHS